MAIVRVWIAIASSGLTLALATACVQSDSTPDAVETPRLYVLDGGVLASDPARYLLTEEDVGETRLSVAAYLVVHPQGVLLWEAGAIADAERIPEGTGLEQRVVRQDGNERFVTLGLPLLEQLEASGYSPADVTHLAMSHYHWDHTANANVFADALWLTSQGQREAMFAAEPPGGTRPATYSSLKDSRMRIIDEDEHDVFGDGTVVIKRAPGHTEGHSVLYVKLADTGRIVLSGDLYHYPAERELGRLPTFEVSQSQTTASRAAVEEFLSRTGADLWIQHDLTHHRQLKTAPAYYD